MFFLTSLELSEKMTYLIQVQLLDTSGKKKKKCFPKMERKEGKPQFNTVLPYFGLTEATGNIKGSHRPDFAFITDGVPLCYMIIICCFSSFFFYESFFKFTCWWWDWCWCKIVKSGQEVVQGMFMKEGEQSLHVQDWTVLSDFLEKADVTKCIIVYCDNWLNK